MRKFVKILAVLLGLLTGVVLITLAILVNLDFNDYREDIAAQVSKATGRDFAINGDLEVDISMVPIVKASGIVLGNAAWSATPNMLKAEHLSIEVDLLSLIFNPIDVHNISISGVEILLETAPSGIKNYQFSEAAVDEKPKESPKARIDNATDRISGGKALPILRQIDLDNIKITFLDGATGDQRKLTIKEVTLFGDEPTNPMQLTIEAVGEQDISAVLNGVLGSPEEMLDPNKPWSVDIFGDVAGVAIDVSGTIMDPTTGADMDLKIAADGPELSNVAKLLLVDAPNIGKFRLDARLSGSVGVNLSLTDFALEFGATDTILVQAMGQLEDINKMTGIDLDIDVISNDLDNISPFFEKATGMPMPFLGGLKLDANLQGGADSGLSLHAFNLDVGAPEMIKLSASGNVANLLKLEGVSMDVVIVADEIGKLSKISQAYTGYAIPAIGPIDFKSTFKGGLNTTLTLQSIDVELGKRSLVKLGASGTIADLYNQEGIALILSVDAEDISRVNNIAHEFNFPIIPKIGPLTFNGAFTGGLHKELSLSDLNLRAGNGELFLLYVKGGIKDVIDPKGLAVDINGKVTNLKSISELVGEDLPALGPIEFKASIAGDKQEKLDITNISALIGKSDFSGDFSYDATGKRPKVKGRLRSKLLRKVDFVKIDGQTKTSNDNSASSANGLPSVGANPSKQSGKYVISQEPIAFDFLKLADGDFDVKVASLDVNEAKLQDVVLAATLVNGLLTVPKVQFSDRDGNPASLSLILDSTRSIPTVNAKLSADNFEIKELVTLAGLPDFISGPLEINADVSASGKSQHDFARTLTGHASLFLADGLIDSEKVRDHYTGDVELLTDLVLGRADDGMQVVHCIAFDYDIKNGLVETNANVLDTKASTITSTGQINLATEELGLTITPHRSVVGLPATVPILVGGTFQKPNYLPNPVGTVLNLTKSLLGGAANIVTLGGVGQSLFSENSPCVHLRPSEQEKNQVQQQQFNDDLKDNPEKAIKNLLKGIFQN